MVSGPVTDPELLRQLESDSGNSSSGPVTDPALLAQLESNQPSDPVQSPEGFAASQVLDMTPWSKVSSVLPKPVSGLFRNASTEIPRNMAGMAVQAKQGLYDIPKAIFDLPRDLAQGKNPNDTELGKFTREGTSGISDSISNAVQHPIKTAYENPIATTMLLSGVARGTSKMFGGVKNKSAQAINRGLQIKEGTLEDMTPRGGNPSKVGSDLGGKLYEEGLAGKSASEALDIANKNAENFGKAVSDSVEKIKNASRPAGAYFEGYDPLKQEANGVLKPLLDKANELRDSGYPSARFESKYYRAAYESLAKKANQGSGYISLDDVRSELKNVGKMIGGASEEHYKPLGRIYGRLMDIQDAMIENVSKQSGNSNIGPALKDANAGYSRYMRILPDLFRQASKEGVGKANPISGEPLKAIFKSVEPKVAKGAYTFGKAGERATNVLPDMTGLGNKPNMAIAAGSKLNTDKAREYLRKAKGDRDLARKMAKADGWQF